jgi:hypothetical protein
MVWRAVGAPNVREEDCREGGGGHRRGLPVSS